MGSSAKKKKEKKKDFQKTKLKVGKAKAKPTNFTDTSFHSKAIVIGEQYHSVETPEELIQHFKHQLSLASTARSDKLRREALVTLTDQLTAVPPINPVGTRTLLTKLLPLISDSSTPVRAQLLKLLRSLPHSEVKDEAERVAIFVRAGMTHLSADISSDALAVIEWLLDVARDELVACPGGWVKTLNSFCALMGWHAVTGRGWTSSAKPTLRVKDAATRARQMTTMARFLQAGLKPELAVARSCCEYTDNLYRVPRMAQPFEYLNLVGAKRDEDGEMYTSREARQAVFQRRFLEAIARGADTVKREGGTAGRGAAVLEQTLRDGMEDFQEPTSVDVDELIDFW